MGTPEFAVASLDALLQAGINIIAVITAPDKPAGRGMKMNESAVKKFAVEKGLLVLQPEKLKNPGVPGIASCIAGRFTDSSCIPYVTRKWFGICRQWARLISMDLYYLSTVVRLLLTGQLSMEKKKPALLLSNCSTK